MTCEVIQPELSSKKNLKRSYDEIDPLPNFLYLKKHIKNARELEKSRRREVIIHTVNSWIDLRLDEQIIPSSTLRDYITCIKKLVKLMGYHFKKNLLFPSLIYATKFVTKVGKVRREKVFHLLLISALVTVKFWEDTGVDLELTSEVFGIDKTDIIEMEKTFLAKIDYSLMLSTKDVDSFKYQKLSC